MKIHWLLLTIVCCFSPVQLYCVICSFSTGCRNTTDQLSTTSTALHISCNTTDIATFDFIDSINFTNVQNITLQIPNIVNLNLTSLSFVTNVNLSNSNITGVYNESCLTNVSKLNLANNSIQAIKSNYSKLEILDLSYNLVSNLSASDLTRFAIKYLNLAGNQIVFVRNLTLNSLKWLNLSSNSINDLQLGSLHNLTLLDLSNNSLTEIKFENTTQLLSLEILNVSKNKIAILNDSNFVKTPVLVRLDLSHNFIKKLTPKCFFGLNRLQHLDVRFNQLVDISPSSLQYLPGLVELMLSGNSELRSKDFGLLISSRRLQQVDASSTNQAKIPSSLTRSVRSLDLNSNNISEIESGDLDSYPLLQTLNLTNNSISCIEDDALGRLELLKTLILDKNELTVVPHTLPSNLKTLSLSRNLIAQINGNDFSGLAQLQRLDLSYNLIINITEGIFAPLKSLELLDLSGNKIKILSSSTFVGLRKLKILHLRDLTEVVPCEQVICFPVPESNQLQELDLHQSAILADRLLKDVAALKTLKQLVALDLRGCNLSQVRDDLPTFLPRISTLVLEDNPINCSTVEWMFGWLKVSRIAQCEAPLEELIPTTETIIISELVTTTDITSANQTDTTPNYDNYSIVFEPDNSTEEFNFTKEMSLENSTEVKVLMNLIMKEQDMETESTQYNLTSEDILSNEIWYHDSEAGPVYAYSTEVPSSHPGLFILLLLPIALVSTCLVINYSRLKRNLRQEQYSASEIEIPDFSNELW